MPGAVVDRGDVYLPRATPGGEGNSRW